MDNFCKDTVIIWRFIGEVVYIIRIVIPIIIVVLGTIDLGKAVMAGEEKTVKEAQRAFIKRLIYGIAVFFVTTIVKVIFGLLGLELDQGDTKVCWDCASKPHAQECKEYVKDYENNKETKYQMPEENESEEENEETLDEM